MSVFEKFLGNAALKIFKGFVIEKDIDPSAIDHSNIKNILIIIRHQMGDMLCALPMLHSVRTFYPRAHITLITKNSTKFTEIFDDENSPVNDVKLFESGFENFINLAKELRDKKIDLAIVPSSVNFSATNHLIAYYSDALYRTGVRSKDFEANRISYVLNIKNDYLWDSKKVHQIERNLDIIRQFGIIPSEKTISLQSSSKCDAFAERFIRDNFPDKSSHIIGMHPGAAKIQNIWPAESFAKLAKILNNEYKPYFLITEGPVDKQHADKLENLLKSYSINAVRIKESLGNCLAVIKNTSLFISNDTGIMHIASGLKVPTIGLFGPTRAEEWGPIGEKMISIRSVNGKMESIDPERVYETCKDILGV